MGNKLECLRGSGGRSKVKCAGSVRQRSRSPVTERENDG